MPTLQVHGLAVLLCCAPLAAQGVPEITFGTLRRNFPNDGNADNSGLRHLALVEWDGDGDLDVLRCSAFQCIARIELLENDGSARFTKRFEFTDSVLDAVAGDLDGDGDPDAWLTGSPGSHRVLWNDGSAGMHVGSVGAQAQVLADLDGNGSLDGVQTLNGVSWSPNLGNEAFGPSQGIDARQAFGEALVADLDGDGDADVFRVLVTGELAFLFNDGAGGFADQRLLPPAFIDLQPSFYVLQAAGDVDGDGLAEVFYGDAHFVDPHGLHMLRNRGAHEFEDTSEDLPELAQVSFLALADVEGDLDLDLLTSQGVLLNDGAGSFRPGSALPAGSDVSTGDMDGDGTVDLVYGTTNQILFNDGAGNFGGLELEPFPSGGSELGDIDGDGDLDMGALRNDGRGELSRVPGTDLGAHDHGTTLPGDLDGDGDLDLFFVGLNEVALNDGSGVFALAGACIASTRDAYDTALGDLDGDGDLDAYVGRRHNRGNCDPIPCYDPRLDVLLLNDGTGCFHDASALLPQDPRVTSAVDLADLDGVGDVDVITNGPRLLLNSGGGAFVDASDRIAGIAPASDVVAGDLDGDGALDLYFGGQPDFVLWNDGTAHFPVASTSPGTGSHIALGDLDLDGDLDVIESMVGCPPFWGSHVLVLANDGSTFRVVSSTPGGPPSRLGDVDGDGDLDYSDGTRVVFNLRRSLAQRGLARLGRDLALELHGSRNGGALLVAASALAPAATPFGLRQIALDARLFARQVALDGEGRAEAHFTVPGDATLIGTTLHWQALISTPLRWSAREETTVTGF